MTKQTREQKEALAIAKGLYGVQKIKALNLAGRCDLALAYADELLIGKGFHYGRGHQASSPYTPKCWEVLEQKREFDDRRIPYTPEAVRSGLKGTCIEFYVEEPSQKGVNNIDDVLTRNDVHPDERRKFFVTLRERAQKQTTPSDACRFVFAGKETPYAVLAAHTGIARDEVVTHYLKCLFTPEEINSMMFNRESWPQELSKFVKREKVGGNKILGLAERVMSDFKPYFCSSNPAGDKSSFCYGLLTGLSQVSGIEIPKEMVVGALKDRIAAGHFLFEEPKDIDLLYRGIKDDPEIRALREKSLKKEIEHGSSCLLERVAYGIKEFGLNPQEDWLRKAVLAHVNRWEKSPHEFELGSALTVGKKYGLLSEDRIDSVKRKLKLLKSLE